MIVLDPADLKAQVARQVRRRCAEVNLLPGRVQHELAVPEGKPAGGSKDGASRSPAQRPPCSRPVQSPFRTCCDAGRRAAGFIPAVRPHGGDKPRRSSTQDGARKREPGSDPRSGCQGSGFLLTWPRRPSHNKKDCDMRIPAGVPPEGVQLGFFAKSAASRTVQSGVETEALR